MSEDENSVDQFEDDEEDLNEDDEGDEEEMIIDKMLEKPIDILDEKEQLNFYTYEKLQIKSLKFQNPNTQLDFYD